MTVVGSQREVHERPVPAAVSGDPRERCAKAAALLEQDRPREALEAVGQANGMADWGYRLLSLAFERLGRDAEAVAAAEEAVRTAPGSWAARLRLGSALRRVPGRRWEAAAQADRAVGYAPEEPDPHVLAGDLALLRGEHREAETSYRAALRLADDHPLARVNLGLALLRWRPPRGHHDPAWPIDPHETGRARDAVEAWSRQVRVLLAVALAVAALLAFRTGLAGTAGAWGVAVLAGVPAITFRRGREVRLWRYVPRMLVRDPWLGVSVSAATLAVVAYVAAIATLPPALAPSGTAWPVLAGFVLLNGAALPFLRVPARAWRGRPVRALAEFAAVPRDRTARRNVGAALWILTVRAWSALVVLLVAAALGEPRLALAAPAVPVALALARPKGTAAYCSDLALAADRLLVATRHLLTLASAALVAVAVVTLLGLPATTGGWGGWAWLACGVPLAVPAGALAARAARARDHGGHDAPGPWCAALAMREGRGTRPPGDTRAPVVLDGDVRRALARSRGVVLAFTDREGPRTLAAEVAAEVNGADGELRLAAPAEAWEAVGRDPRVAVFVTDPVERRFWAEVRGVAVGDAETGVLRITPKRVLVPHHGRYRNRHRRHRRGVTRTR